MPGRNYIAGQLLSLLSLPQFSPPRKFHQFDVWSMTKGVNASGLNPLSALQRVVTIAKLTTLLSAALTILCAVVIVGGDGLDSNRHMGVVSPRIGSQEPERRRCRCVRYRKYTQLRAQIDNHPSDGGLVA
jgi:hypothetical protein